MRRLFSLAMFSVIFTIWVVAPAGTLAKSPRKTTLATALTSRFHTYGDSGVGWTGGDSTYSVPLPDGRTAWLFSDTFLGPVRPDHTRDWDATLIHNSIVLEDAAGLKTLHGTGGLFGARKSLIEPRPADPVTFYWIGDGTVEGDKLRVFALRFIVQGWNFIHTATDIATFSLPDMTLESLTAMPLGVPPTPSGGVISFGSAIMETADFTYIYGVEDRGATKFLHVARVPVGGLLGSWEFYNGIGWDTNPLNSARLLDGIANEFSVVPTSTGYRLVTSDKGIGANIYSINAASPTGPWTGKRLVYATPETGGNIITYNAKEHPQLSTSTELFISYNVNSFDYYDLMRDVHIYRPRFVQAASG